MGILKEIREFKNRQLLNDDLPFEANSFTSVELTEVQTLLKKIVVTEYERPMFEYAAKQYESDITYLFMGLLEGDTKPLNDEKRELLKRIILDVACEAQDILITEARNLCLYNKFVGAYFRKSNVRSYIRCEAARTVLERAKKHGIDEGDVIRACVAFGCRHPELMIDDRLYKKIAVKDVVDHAIRLLGIPKVFEDSYEKALRI